MLGGAVFGVREAPLTVAANGFVQPTANLAAYLAFPVFACTLLGGGLLLVLGFGLAVRRRTQSPAPALPLYVAVLAFGGTLSITVPLVSDIVACLADVGAPTSPELRLIFTLLALASAATMAAVGWAAAWWGERSLPVLRRAGWGAALLTLLLLVPAARFVLADWKWDLGYAPPDGDASKPNVVLISIDTLRADHLGSYGDRRDLTPNLDQLAADGVVPSASDRRRAVDVACHGLDLHRP
jgi:hypothetical protein